MLIALPIIILVALGAVVGYLIKKNSELRRVGSALERRLDRVYTIIEEPIDAESKMVKLKSVLIREIS